jgi:hypothetical protein
MSLFEEIKRNSERKKYNRYQFQINRLKNLDLSTDCIEKTVEETILNIQNGARSLAIYGEPQSGKTEMMIALTAKLLDEKNQIIIHLVNDNIELKEQNLSRLAKSKITPSPKDFTEVIPPEVNIGKKQWIIFCKKNTRNLQDLIEKIDNFNGKVIIDDEADYASPNSKINKGIQSKINELVGKLIDQGGIYIGVTATPDRLHLNKTFDNDPSNWVLFEPHSHYQGKDYYFPVDRKKDLDFTLVGFSDEADISKQIIEAALRFIVKASFINVTIYKEDERGFSMLIHTAGEIVKHQEDYKLIQNLINTLSDKENLKHEKLWQRVEKLTLEMYPDNAKEVLDYTYFNIGRHTTVEMNSTNSSSFKFATNPEMPFTFVFGGNIISRGLTFNNLLCMFFARAAKTTQADTYIQRARMFGARGELAKYFELHIPFELYEQWWRCFWNHRIGLRSITNGYAVPIAVGSSKHKIRPAASSSIDKMHLNMDKGEIYWKKFKYTDEIKNIQNKLNLSDIEKLKNIQMIAGDEVISEDMIDMIGVNESDFDDKSVVLHDAISIVKYESGETNEKEITRERGFIGSAGKIEKKKYPDALHHFFIFTNSDNEGRIYYKHAGFGYTYYSNLRNKK